MSTYIQNFKKFQPLLSELIARDIKIKYRKSVLGVLWTLLNPLFMMIILSIVFMNLFRFDVEYFPVYLLSGQLIFNFYSESTNTSMSAIMDNGPLIKKIYVPKYLFVLSRVSSSTINLLASFTALICVMLAMRVELHYMVLLAPIPLFFFDCFFAGSGVDLISNYGEIQGCDALIFSVCYCTDVFDTGDLSHVYFARVVRAYCQT